jgi:enoyl-CoA hydratase/carnithine racemase
MTDGSDSAPLHVAVARGAALSVPQGPQARVLLVEVGSPEPDAGEIARLDAALSAPHLISVASATGRVSAATAAVVLACDFLVAAPDSSWRDAAAEVASAAQRRLPAQRAAMLAAASELTGAALHQAGLVTELSPDPRAAAEALANELTVVPTRSLAGSKEMIDTAATSDLDTAFDLESRLQIDAMYSEEHQRIVREQSLTRPAPAPADGQT